MERKATIRIRGGLLKAYENMFSFGTDEITAYGLPKLSNISTWTARFDDGCEAEIKVNTSEDDVWSEGVLFDGSGSELCCTEVCDNLKGEWKFEVNGDCYVVDVVEDGQ